MLWSAKNLHGDVWRAFIFTHFGSEQYLLDLDEKASWVDGWKNETLERISSILFQRGKTANEKLMS